MYANPCRFILHILYIPRNWHHNTFIRDLHYSKKLQSNQSWWKSKLICTIGANSSSHQKGNYSLLPSCSFSTFPLYAVFHILSIAQVVKRWKRKITVQLSNWQKTIKSPEDEMPFKIPPAPTAQPPTMLSFGNTNNTSVCIYEQNEILTLQKMCVSQVLPCTWTLCWWSCRQHFTPPAHASVGLSLAQKPSTAIDAE